MRSARWWLGAVLGGLLLASWGVACGARSSLEVIEGSEEPLPDAGQDAEADVEVDAPEDAPLDAPLDAPPDAPIECETPDETYIYVVTSQNRMWSYRPITSSFVLVGELNCPSGAATPFSMAVDRAGTAHIVYQDGRLYRVSTEDASCEVTPFQPGQQGFNLFGMGYGDDQDGEDETLYVAQIEFGQQSLGLASIDTNTYELTYIGPFSQNPGDAIELTPTGDGPLYGYFLNNSGPGGTLVQIDANDATIVEATPLTVGPASSALAIGWWGGQFYIFVTGGAGSQVFRYNPNSQQTQLVAQLNETIVGAGVSTCAPGAFPSE